MKDTPKAKPAPAGKPPRLPHKSPDLLRRRYREIYDFAPIAYFELTAGGEIQAVNFQAARLLSRRPEDVLGTSFLELVALASRDLCRDHFREILRTGRRARVELRMANPRGGFMSVGLESLPWPGDRECGILTAVTDETDRLVAEKESARLLAAVEEAGDSIAVIQLDGEILYVNKAFESLNSISRADVLRKSYFRILAPVTEGSEWAKNAVGSIARGTSWTGRVRRRGSGRKPTVVDLMLSPIHEMPGRIFNYLVVERDVTRVIDLEEHVRAMQRSQALGLLAGGIAHDLNNALGPIIINAETLLLDEREGGASASRLDMILKAAYRARDLIRRIPAFASNRGGIKKAIDLSEAVGEALAFLRAGLPSTIEIRDGTRGHPGLVLADPVQIQQVIVNLVTNASQAMKDRGGILCLDLERAKVGPEAGAGLEALKPGNYLRLIVKDTGPGMEPAILARIFDPFFTTRPSAEGTGLGLTVVRGIVFDHDGAVTADSVPGEGATFSVYLPEFLGTPSPLPVRDEVLPPGAGRILLIDDEDLQILSWKLALERFGYGITSASDPKEALRIFRENPLRFNLVITDLTMPRLTGLDVAREIHKLKPGIPIILCTGFSERVDRKAAEADGVRLLLEKPLGLAEMIQAVQTALAVPT